MKISKYSTLGFMALSLLLTPSLPASAQTSNTNTPVRPPRRQFSPEQRLERMATELNLTAEQKTKVSAAMEEQQKKLIEIRNDKDLTSPQRQEKFRAEREEFRTKLKGILTSEQFEKWQKMDRPPTRNRRSEGGNPPPPQSEKKLQQAQ